MPPPKDLETDDFKPNGRPQSTIALDFSASLDTVFAIQEPHTPELVDLAQSVEQKKQAVNSQSQELQELEQRLKEAEERLKISASGRAKGSGQHAPLAEGSENRGPRPGTGQGRSGPEGELRTKYQTGDGRRAFMGKNDPGGGSNGDGRMA